MRDQNHYHERVNRVLDYIGEHLTGELSLRKLSRVGCFSPYHFHRIFQALTGETLNSHVRRVRIERAATLLKASPRKRITDAALEAGFAGIAEFSRAFQNRFGRTASSWDRRSPLEKSKICKAPDVLSVYTLEELERWRSEANVRVRVHLSSAFRYVYSRTFDPYCNARLVDAYRSLMAWLAERATDVRDVVVIGMSLDDPAITPSEKCRYDLGAAFPKQPGGDCILGEIVRWRGRTGRDTSLPGRPECGSRGFSVRDFEPQSIAVLPAAGDLSRVDRAWQYLYRVWLPASRFEPADFPAMEMFVRLPEEIGWETFDLRACIPLKETTWDNP
jgi:AraC family transcriptional regulator